jgi:hypothetical protein
LCCSIAPSGRKRYVGFTQGVALGYFPAAPLGLKNRAILLGLKNRAAALGFEDWFLVCDWIYAPTGPGTIAQGNALGYTPFSFFAALKGQGKGRGRRSIPYILFVVPHAMFFQELPEFLLKRHSPVMLFL